MDEQNLQSNLPVAENSAVKKESTNLKMFFIGFSAVVATVLVACAGAGIYRAYAKGYIDNFTLTVANILRLPAMKVDGTRVLYSEYVEDLRAIQKLQSVDSAALTLEQMSDSVLWRLANNIWINATAVKYGIKVEQTDLDEIKAQVMSQFSDTASMEAEIQNHYGWNYKKYEDKVIRSYILQNKLDAVISQDLKKREAARNLAQEVLNKIKGGADFAEMAKQYGSDSTKTAGGDLGFFAKGDMVPEFENAVLALKTGELSPELVETQYGYHIIKFVEKKTEKEKNDNGVTVNVEKYRASHILFPFPSVATELDSMGKQAIVHLYLRVHNPFAELKK